MGETTTSVGAADLPPIGGPFVAAAQTAGLDWALTCHEWRRMHDWYAIRGNQPADWSAAWRRWLDNVKPDRPPLTVVAPTTCGLDGCENGWRFDLEGNARRCHTCTEAATA